MAGKKNIPFINVEELWPILDNIEKARPTMQISIDGESFLPINKLKQQLWDTYLKARATEEREWARYN